MRRFGEGTDRGQSTLFPECLGDYLGEDNPVRAIDVFVDELDLAKLGFDGVVPEVTGRPAYHPATLLKIYVYGYLNRVQSSRRLERECQRNIELVWLTGRLMPDFKTIADFRKDNGEAIRKVCREFVVLCRRLELFNEASVAIDGSKFKAVNARDRNFTQAKMQRRLEQIDESIARYLSQLDSADRQGEAVPEAKITRLNEKIVALRQEIQRLDALNVQMMHTEDKQISLTDSDARSSFAAAAATGRGLVSRAGMIGLYDARDTAGPMARTVEDLVVLLDVIAGFDADDCATSVALGKTSASYAAALKPAGLRGKRIGVLRQACPRGTSDPQIIALLDRVVADLQGQGAIIVDPFEVPDFGKFPAQSHSLSEMRAATGTYLSTTVEDFP